MSKPKVTTKPVISAEDLVCVSQVLGCRHHGIVLPISRNGICAVIRDGRVSPPIQPEPEVIARPSKQVRAMLDVMKAVGQ
jgi:hypothetical protein